MKRLLMVGAGLCLYASSMVCVVHAAIINTFSVKSDFIAITSATNATDPIPNLGGLGNGNSAMLGDITLNLAGGSTQFFVGNGAGPDWTPANTGNDIAISGDENFDVVLNAPVFAFGFDVVEPDGTFTTDPNNGLIKIPTGSNSVFELSLFNGMTAIGMATFELFGSLDTNPAIDFLEFIGITSDTAFDRVEVRETVAFGNTNDYFGDFYIGEPVPIPAAFWLFGSAIGLLFWARRTT